MKRPSTTKTKAKRKPLPTIAKLKQKAQTLFNNYVRKRDQLPDGTWKCIACGETTIKVHASHYFERRRFPRLAFNESNVHTSCSKCNLYLRGNLIAYRKNLEKKIGTEALEGLEEFGFSPVCKEPYNREELNAIIQQYKCI